MKVKNITIPIYKSRLRMIQIFDLTLLNKRYKLNIEDRFSAIVFYHTEKNGAVIHCVAFEDGKVSGNTIAHEVAHLVNNIFYECGIKPDTHNDEPQAYLTGWLFEQIENFLNQQ